MTCYLFKNNGGDFGSSSLAEVQRFLLIGKQDDYDDDDESSSTYQDIFQSSSEVNGRILLDEFANPHRAHPLVNL